MGVFPSQIIEDKKVSCGLNIGCGYGGTCFREPYVNLDLNRKKHLESWKKKGRQPPICFVVGDACNLPFGDGAFDELYASHLLEHFNWSFTIRILREWQRVLVEGGILKICVPDFGFAVKLYTGEIQQANWDRGGLTQRKNGKIYGIMGHLFRVIFGWVDVKDGQKVGHKMIFDFDLLKWVLEQAGFKDVRSAEIHSVPYKAIRAEICVVATKC